MEIEKVKELSAAGRLYLILLMWLGHEAVVMPKTKIMTLLGVETERTYYKIRKELLDLGFLEKVEAEYTLRSSLISSANVPPRSGNGLIDRLNDMSSSSIYLSVSQSGKPSAAAEGVVPPHGERAEGASIVPMGHVQIGQYTVQNGQSPSKMDSEGPNRTVEGPNWTVHLDGLLRLARDSSVPLSDRCLDADGLDGSGSPNSTTSNFYVRRRVQLALMEEIWKQTFPTSPPLPEGTAKKFLLFCGDSIERFKDDLEEIVGKAKNIGNPQKYIHIALENNRNAPPREPKPRPVSPARPRPTYKRPEETKKEGHDFVGDDELHKPTEAEVNDIKEKQNEWAKLFGED